MERRYVTFKRSLVSQICCSEKLCDRGIPSKSEFTKPFDSAICNRGRKESGPANTDWLIRQYAEFRRLMREETAVDSPTKDRESEGENESMDEEEAPREQSREDEMTEDPKAEDSAPIRPDNTWSIV
jgi:hypothetical protein